MGHPVFTQSALLSSLVLRKLLHRCVVVQIYGNLCFRLRLLQAQKQGRREVKKSPIQVTSFNGTFSTMMLYDTISCHDVFMGPSSGHGPRYSVPSVPPLSVALRRSLSCVIVERRIFFISFSLLKDLSALATLTGVVRRINGGGLPSLRAHANWRAWRAVATPLQISMFITGKKH